MSRRVQGEGPGSCLVLSHAARRRNHQTKALSYNCTSSRNKWKLRATLYQQKEGAGVEPAKGECAIGYTSVPRVIVTGIWFVFVSMLCLLVRLAAMAI